LIGGFQNIPKIPELNKRILFTFCMLLVFRLGSHIPTPGIDSAALSDYFNSMQGTLVGLFNMFSGGNLKRMSIMALGIMPYISASIILELLSVVVPYLEKLKKEGEQGRKKIIQYTRYGTVVLSAIQGFGIAIWLEKLSFTGGAPVVPSGGWGYRILAVITFTAGTAFLMWLGEQITEKGIGNGISLIIFAGIVAGFFPAVFKTIEYIKVGTVGIFTVIIIVALMIAVVAAIVFIERGQRRIPVQYAKRVVGRKMYGGQSTHLPLKINTAGVIPPIFASSILMFPVTIAQYFHADKVPWLNAIVTSLNRGAITYNLLYVIFIIFFCFFYTAVHFNPMDVSDNMKKYGGFIPGIRPGKNTAEYIDRILTRITLCGAIYVSIICVLPSILTYKLSMPFYFGGTGLLIVVGVAMDTASQIESHMLVRHYDGFMKKGLAKK
jgi:preprotein translocase subunit SecY